MKKFYCILILASFFLYFLDKICYGYNYNTEDIICHHSRDYRDKRNDPDFIEKMYNYAGSSVQDSAISSKSGSPGLIESIVGGVALGLKGIKKAIKPINHDFISCT